MTDTQPGWEKRLPEEELATLQLLWDTSTHQSPLLTAHGVADVRQCSCYCSTEAGKMHLLVPQWAKGAGGRSREAEGGGFAQTGEGSNS